MSNLFKLIEQKNKRIEEIPLRLQTVIEKRQRAVFNDILKKLSDIEEVDGSIKISTQNLKKIEQISVELESVLVNDEYLKAVKQFVSQFDSQALLNDKIIKAGLGEDGDPTASRTYINLAKKNAKDSLIGSSVNTNFAKPISDILEKSVVNGSTVNDTIDSLKEFIDGDTKNNGKFSRYVKQITNDSFAVADRSYTSILSDYLGAEWFYYAGTEVEHTRCFCKERVGRYFHYKEIESWANGENLGQCNIGGGKWAGMIKGTNSSNIYSYLGGYNCLHSIMPVSFAGVPQSDIDRAIELGFYKPEITKN